jgi:hypothetical protein
LDVGIFVETNYTMNHKLTKIAGVALVLFLHSCTTPLSVTKIDRPIDRQSSAWNVVGSVRITTYALLASAPIPYDQLLQAAQAEYGKDVDVIEIKVESKGMSAIEKRTYFKENKRRANYALVHNALVVRYGSNAHSSDTK